MLLNIKAHFDGKAIIPDQPVELPVNAPLTINIEVAATTPTAQVADQQARESAFQRIISAPHYRTTPIPDGALRRESMYDDQDDA